MRQVPVFTPGEDFFVSVQGEYTHYYIEWKKESENYGKIVRYPDEES